MSETDLAARHQPTRHAVHFQASWCSPGARSVSRIARVAPATGMVQVVLGHNEPHYGSVWCMYVRERGVYVWRFLAFFMDEVGFLYILSGSDISSTLCIMYVQVRMCEGSYSATQTHSECDQLWS